VLTAWLLLFLGLMPPLLDVAEVEAQPAEDVQKRGKKIAAQQLLLAAIEGLYERGVETKTLTSKILGKPAEHKNRFQSEKILKAWVQLQLQADLEAQLPKISSELNKEKQWVSLQKLREMLDSLKPNQTIQRVLSEKFPAASKEARNKAVEIQYKQVKTGIYPQPAEVEAIDQGGNKQRKKIEANIKQNMAGKLVLLEENDGRVQQKIGAVIDDALQQLRQQREILSRADVEGISDTVIRRNLGQEIQNFIAEQKKQQKEGGKIYDIFPSVENTLPETAQRLMMKRFEAFLSSDFSRFFSEKRIKHSIRTNIPAHRASLDASVKILSKQLKPKVKSQLVSEYAAKAKKEGGGGAFRTRLERLLNEERSLRLAYENQFNGTLENLTDKVRKELAKEQLARFFPEISNGEWRPSDDEIHEDWMAGKVGEVKINDLLNNASVSQENLLKETENDLRDAVRTLRGEGLTAYGAQLKLVVDHKESISEKIAGDTKEQSKEYWIADYTNTVKSFWNKKRFQLNWETGSRAPKKYAELFNGTKEEIKKIIARIFNYREKHPPLTGGRRGGRGGDGGGGRGGGRGGGKGDGIGDSMKSLLLFFPWYLWVILALILLLIVALVIWLVKRRKNRTSQTPLPGQTRLSGGIRLTELKDGFIIKGKYIRGKNDTDAARATLERALGLLQNES